MKLSHSRRDLSTLAVPMVTRFRTITAIENFASQNVCEPSKVVPVTDDGASHNAGGSEKPFDLAAAPNAIHKDGSQQHASFGSKAAFTGFTGWIQYVGHAPRRKTLSILTVDGL